MERFPTDRSAFSTTCGKDSRSFIHRQFIILDRFSKRKEKTPAAMIWSEKNLLMDAFE
jgi:hypothetical protein